MVTPAITAAIIIKKTIEPTIVTAVTLLAAEFENNPKSVEPAG